MANQSQAQTLLQIVSKIEIFQGLSPSEAARMLKACRSENFSPSQIIYQAGEPSHEMFILLQGRLKVVGKNGTSLAEIAPGTCCGEMGVFTGLPRSATVVATQKSVGFSINRQDFFNVLKSNQDIHIKILQNVITLLCQRLAHTDDSIEDYAGKLKRAEEEHGMLDAQE